MSSRKYKQYPAEFRESSAKLALETDQPMSQTARELVIFEYIEVFYNRIRLHSANNYMSPVHFEQSQNVA